MPVLERPEFNFTMLGLGSEAVRSAAHEIERVFGKENYDEYRRAGKMGIYIPAESCLRVDTQVYSDTEDVFDAGEYGGKRLWHDSMLLAKRSLYKAAGILFPDQDKRATLTTKIAWSDNRPSTILKVLTAPTKSMGVVCKYEQGRQLGFAFKGTEVIMEDGNGEEADVPGRLNDFFEDKLFVGKNGETTDRRVYSYHSPDTNSIVGLSDNNPDPKFNDSLWVKKIDFPVRQLVIRDEIGKIVETVPVLYDPREKDKESMVIKGLYKSLTARETDEKDNGGLIEAIPYMQDKFGFRLVLMNGGHALRDRVTAYVEELFKKFEGYDSIEPDDEVDSRLGDPNRIQFKRKKILLKTLRRPIEMQVFTVEDWLRQEYEIGRFNPEKNMHDGVAHDLYDLSKVVDIAGYSWPFTLFKIDHAVEQRMASFEIAARLARKQRIHPSPYEMTS